SCFSSLLSSFTSFCVPLSSFAPSFLFFHHFLFLLFHLFFLFFLYVLFLYSSSSHLSCKEIDAQKKKKIQKIKNKKKNKIQRKMIVNKSIIFMKTYNLT